MPPMGSRLCEHNLEKNARNRIQGAETEKGEKIRPVIESGDCRTKNRTNCYYRQKRGGVTERSSKKMRSIEHHIES